MPKVNFVKSSLFIRILSILIGSIFIISAVLKQISINTFEIYVYSLNLFDFNLATLFTRLLIGFEFLLGVLFILNIYRRVVKLTIILTLLVFSIFLLVQFLIGNVDNCNCFGEFIELNPLESLFKNLIILFLVIISGKSQERILKYKKIILGISTVLIFSIPFILSPPDFIHNAIYGKHNPDSLEANPLLDQFVEEYQLSEGKQILCFFSMSCKYCKMTANKISIIADRLNCSGNIQLIFHGDKQKLDEFWKESNSQIFQYYFIPSRDFLRISGGRVPIIFFIDNSELEGIYGYRGVNEKKVNDFINN